VLCICFLIALETGSAYLLKHHSVTYRRVSQQFAEAAATGRSKSGEPRSVLMIGNSLFLEGVQIDRLHELTAGNLSVFPIFLEGTGYYDWLYGLRRVFREGARPQVVVVQLDANSFLWNQVRTEYSPRLLFDAADLIRASWDLGLDRTATSSLLLSHWSAYWGGHSVIRTQILRWVIPNFAELFSLVPLQRNALRQNQGRVQFGPEFESTVAGRVETLRELCGAYGAKTVMLIPPTPSSENTARALRQISKRVGVTALIPIDPALLTARDYEADALHLNPDGAALFTSAIARLADHFYSSEVAF
jgi:hypothetical protein